MAWRMRIAAGRWNGSRLPLRAIGIGIGARR
jgi:hypothetical protein